MSLALREMLEALTQMQIDLMINNNRSTMLSILERRRKYARLSLHRMFLGASNPVIIALAELIQNKKSPQSNRLIREFINSCSDVYETKRQLDTNKLITQGRHYDLIEHYNRVNAQYFDRELKLHITWFGNRKRPRSHLTFGLYHEPTKLIKINRLLDHENVPTYFLEYIIYHEMLHEMHRPELTPSGRRRVHTPSFKKQEKLFQEYDKAKSWEQNFQRAVFK